MNLHVWIVLLLLRRKSDLSMRSRRNGRTILHPILSRFVIIDSAGCSGIDPNMDL